MKRHTAVILLGTGLVTGFAAGSVPRIGAGVFGSSWRLPAPQAEAAETADSKNLALFDEVIQLVRDEYVDPQRGDSDLIANAISGMLTALDAHSAYLDPKAFHDLQTQTQGSFGGLGMELSDEHGTIRVVTPLDDTPAMRAGIHAGDRIQAIDGQSTEGLTINQAVDKLRGEPNTSVSVTVRREGVNEPIELRMTREIIHIQVVRARLEGDVGYIRVTQFGQQTEPELRAALQRLTQEAGGRLKGLIIDLRNNPGGLLDQGITVAQDFLDAGEIVTDRGRKPRDNQRWDAKPGGDLTRGTPLVVLINEGTASAAEILAGALQDNRRAILLGTRSFGKGSVQTVFPLANNGAIRLTTARYYTPSGRSIQDLGITPDVEVQQSRSGKPISAQREVDLAHALKNTGGIGNAITPPARTDLPPIVHQIPREPPEGWPELDPAKPETDFQLQQAIKLIGAMVAQTPATK